MFPFPLLSALLELLTNAELLVKFPLFDSISRLFAEYNLIGSLTFSERRRLPIESIVSCFVIVMFINPTFLASLLISPTLDVELKRVV